jgi:hypothetical protein
MSELRVWQRRHAPNIVAEVRPVGGMGTWDICTWLDAGSPERCEGGRHALLTEAHLAADVLAATTFDHRCDAACGEWNAIERRKAERA